MKKLIRISFALLPLIAIVLVAFSEHSKYLSCLIKYSDAEDTVQTCTLFDK